MSELTHVSRMATAGQLSASIAHEVRQPPAGIVANAQAALRWLEKANVKEVREGLKRILSDGHRASDITTNLSAMFKSDVQEKTLVDINKLVLSVLALVRIDLQKHEIKLQTQLDDRIPQVLGNQVQLQYPIISQMEQIAHFIELSSPWVSSSVSTSEKSEVEHAGLIDFVNAFDQIASGVLLLASRIICRSSSSSARFTDASVESSNA
jgi:phosphoglycerate-specific signal transduction histidine kinase